MSKIKDFLKSPLGTALCAAAACLLAVVLVWLAAVRPNNDKSLSERISDDYSQYSAELDEANGAAQTFDTDNDLLAMAFVFGTSNGQPTGELHLELADADTGEVLARSTGDMANIVAGQYTGMGLDMPKYRSMCVGIVLGQKGTAPGCCEQSRAVVCCQASSITSGSGTSIPFLKPCFTAFFVCWAAAAP